MDIYKPSELKNLLARHGIHLTRARGQNFLIAPWVPQRLCEEAELDKNTGVVEIGAGVGALTRSLAPLAGKVVSLELDYGLKPVLMETLAGFDNVDVRFEDAVKSDFRRIVADCLPGLRPVVCANLPYQATSPLLGRILECRLFDVVTVMVQREVALRMCALPGTSDWGAFSVFIQAHTIPRLCYDVSPDCFFPQPKVTSSVVQLVRTDRNLPPLFFQVVKAAFAQRRKTLQNALSAGLGGRLDKDAIAESIKLCGYHSQIRGEMLGVDNFIALAEFLSKNISEE